MTTVMATPGVAESIAVDSRVITPLAPVLLTLDATAWSGARTTRTS